MHIFSKCIYIISVYTYKYMCVCIHIYIYIFGTLHTYIYMCIYVCMYVSNVQVFWREKLLFQTPITNILKNIREKKQANNF